MTRICITIEGDLEELRTVLRILAEVEPSVEVKNSMRIEEETKAIREDGEYSWTESKVRKVWVGLTFDAKDVLKEIASNPDGVAWDHLTAKFGSARAVGGRLSSLGHQLRIHEYKGTHEYPVSSVLKSGEWFYRFHPVWRDTILKIIEEVENVKE